MGGVFTLYVFLYCMWFWYILCLNRMCTIFLMKKRRKRKRYFIFLMKREWGRKAMNCWFFTHPYLFCTINIEMLLYLGIVQDTSILLYLLWEMKTNLQKVPVFIFVNFVVVACSWQTLGDYIFLLSSINPSIYSLIIHLSVIRFIAL